MPPTTGNTVEISVFAVLIAAASALPLISPVRFIYAVKAMVIPVITVIASHFVILAKFDRIAFENRQFESVTAM